MTKANILVTNKLFALAGTFVLIVAQKQVLASPRAPRRFIMRGIRHTQVNQTYYVGYAYERAYLEKYWTICFITCFNSTYRNQTREGCEISFTFHTKPWLGSRKEYLPFLVNPVSAKTQKKKKKGTFFTLKKSIL